MSAKTLMEYWDIYRRLHLAEASPQEIEIALRAFMSGSMAATGMLVDRFESVMKGTTEAALWARG